jgi:hypothetical protein
MALLVSDPIEQLFSATAAPGRAAEIPESDDAYGWFVGSWELDILRYWNADVSAQRIKGEVHAAWSLEGRAIHDVWIMPRRDDRSGRTGRAGPTDKKLNMYGTTIRAWDASIRAWRISWSNPAGDHFEHQIARRIGRDVVQLGTRPDGTPTRWRFTEITPDSFHWLGESLTPDGQTWTVEGEFLATRTA